MTQVPAEGSILPLRLEHVRYSARGRDLIPDLTLTLGKGRLVALIGPNGAGKSLTLRLCHGLIPPSAGRIRWACEPSRKRHAMVFQRPVLLRRSVRANISYALSVARHPRATRTSRTSEALRQFGLESLADGPARLLSGGEQQRLAMARAWALEPEVLFLDEPTASLDPSAAKAIEEMILRFSAEGTTILMTTHALAQARRLAEEVIFLHEGRIIEQGPAAAFFDTPQSPSSRAFLAAEFLWK